MSSDIWTRFIHLIYTHVKWIVRCAVVESGKTNAKGMLRQRSIGKQLRGEAVMEKLVGIWLGQKGGQNCTSGRDIHFLYIYTVIIYIYIHPTYLYIHGL